MNIMSWELLLNRYSVAITLLLLELPPLKIKAYTTLTFYSVQECLPNVILSFSLVNAFKQELKVMEIIQTPFHWQSLSET